MTSVIVIEDNIDSLEVLCEILQIKGLDVVGRGINGEEGIKLYEQLYPDAVIMDVMMPDYDGFYGLVGIKKIDPFATIVMITADLTKDTAERLKSLSASQILYKPNDLDKIVPAVEKLVDEKNETTKLQISI